MKEYFGDHNGTDIKMFFLLASCQKTALQKLVVFTTLMLAHVPTQVLTFQVVV